MSAIELEGKLSVPLEDWLPSAIRADSGPLLYSNITTQTCNEMLLELDCCCPGRLVPLANSSFGSFIASRHHAVKTKQSMIDGQEAHALAEANMPPDQPISVA